MTIALDAQALAALELSAGVEPGGSIWRDPHLQRQLLAAHLDQSTGAATRGPEAVSRTLEFLRAGLRPGSAVLDLGCGPGIYSQELARRGFDVTGIDANAASIEYARAHAEAQVRYLEGDYTRHLPEGPFDLAMLVYLDFGTHLPEVQRELLRAVRERLRPGGRMIFDYLDAPAAAAHRAGRGWEASGHGGFWSPDPYLLLSGTSVHPDVLAQRIRYTLLTAAVVRRFDVWEHCFTQESIRARCTEAGFDAVALHRDVLAGVDAQADAVVFVVAGA